MQHIPRVHGLSRQAIESDARRASRISALGCVLSAALLTAHGALQAASPAQVASASAAPAPWQHIGRDATPAEVKAWDIDVRPDFKGLPKGRGTVGQGEALWEEKCASCHGVFGESNEVFTPLVGGTSKDDVQTGRVKNLMPGTGYPQRSTLMKVPTLSTLWDYVYRAMPWTQPKSLKPDEVYSLLAYMLSLAEVLPENSANGELSDANIAQVQARMPNRNGMLRHEGLWKLSGKPDVQNTACMKDCPVEMDAASGQPKVQSRLPDFARDAHGNLADQHRGFGPVRALQTVSASAAPGASAVKP